LVSLEALDMEPGFRDGEAEADRAHSLTKLFRLIGKLKPLDRQAFLLYLEGETAPSIAEITGLSAANVATKLHRIRKLLIERFNEGAEHDPRPR
jgi:RNA polymerase sigma-70 factor (ECF subfamily)